MPATSSIEPIAKLTAPLVWVGVVVLVVVVAAATTPTGVWIGGALIGAPAAGVTEGVTAWVTQ